MRLLLPLVFSFICSAAAADFRVPGPDDAKVELAIKGSQFKLAERVPYEVTVTNITRKPWDYEAGTLWLAQLLVLDSSGKQAPAGKMPAGSPNARMVRAEVKPGASFKYSGDLNWFASLTKPGTYTVRADWIPRSTWGGYSFLSNTVEVKITNVEDPVRVDLRIEGKRFKVGQPIPCEVKVTNTSKSDVSYADCGKGNERLIPAYDLAVVDAAGKEPQRPGSLGYDISCGFAKLAPGASLDFHGYVNHWFIMSTPGTYRVTASWATSSLDAPVGTKVQSKQSAIEILTATQKDRDRFLADARAKIESAKTTDQRIDAIWQLAYTLDDRAVPMLKDIWKGSDASIRWEALGGLMAMGTPAARKALENPPALQPDLHKETAK